VKPAAMHIRLQPSTTSDACPTRAWYALCRVSREEATSDRKVRRKITAGLEIDSNTDSTSYPSLLQVLNAAGCGDIFGAQQVSQKQAETIDLSGESDKEGAVSHDKTLGPHILKAGSGTLLALRRKGVTQCRRAS
jgi:hypothetical protein